MNLKSFCFSANYVFGSGFDKFVLTDDQGNEYIPKYSRLDVAVIYKFRPGKLAGKLGVSVLNVLNTGNILFPNLTRIRTGTENPLDVYAEATPFTPTLFLMLKF